MKYKVTVDDVVIAANISCLKVLNLICGFIQGDLKAGRVKIFYQAGNETVGFCWKLQNYFEVN